MNAFSLIAFLDILQVKKNWAGLLCMNLFNFGGNYKFKEVLNQTLNNEDSTIAFKLISIYFPIRTITENEYKILVTKLIKSVLHCSHTCEYLSVR